MQHKYNETSLEGLAIKKQGVEGMAKLVLEGQDICLERKSISLRQYFGQQFKQKALQTWIICD